MNSSIETAGYSKNKSAQSESLISREAQFSGKKVSTLTEQSEVFQLCERHIKETGLYRSLDKWVSGNWLEKCQISVDTQNMTRIFSQYEHSIIFRMPRDENVLLLCCGNEPVNYTVENRKRHLHPKAYTVDQNPMMNPCAVMDWLNPKCRSFLNRKFRILIDEGSLHSMCKTSRNSRQKLTSYFEASREKLIPKGLLILIISNRTNYSLLEYHPNFEKLAFIKSSRIPDRQTAESVTKFLSPSSPCPGLIENLEYAVYYGLAVLRKT